MVKVSEAITKMISLSEGNQHDICHFLKVWGFSRTIGEAEGVDEEMPDRIKKSVEGN